MLPVGRGLTFLRVLFEQGYGEAVTIAGNQLLPPDFFCQREGFAGEGLGFCPLLAVEGEFCQVACVDGNAFIVFDLSSQCAGLRGNRARRRGSLCLHVPHSPDGSARWQHRCFQGRWNGRFPALRGRRRWRQDSLCSVGDRFRAGGWQAALLRGVLSCQCSAARAAHASTSAGWLRR